jgi:hypothetical protein
MRHRRNGLRFRRNFHALTADQPSMPAAARRGLYRMRDWWLMGDSILECIQIDGWMAGRHGSSYS